MKSLVGGIDSALFERFPLLDRQVIWIQDEPWASLPRTHTIYYGKPGTFKSTMAATCPKPMVVFLHDPPDKALPYKRWGQTYPSQDPYYEPLGIEAEDIFDSEGNHLIRIEHYGDDDPLNPIGWTRFEWRMQDFAAEASQWGTAVIDSLTYAVYDSRLREQFQLNPNTKHPMQWYGGAKNALEPMVRARFPRWKTNVVLVAHTAEEKIEGAEGGMLRWISAVGKLGQDMPSGYGEYYHFKTMSDASGSVLPVMQTKTDGLWMASSLINAPNPCPIDYRALWEGWQG